MVNATEPLKYLSYQVLGRGDIITANTITIPERKEATIRFLATYAMAPSAHIIVHYVREDGEVVADVLDIELDGVFQNFVDASISPENTEPGFILFYFKNYNIHNLQRRSCMSLSYTCKKITDRKF